MKLSKRQEAIAHIVREKGPVTGSAIAEHLDVTRSALRSDLAVLTMIGVLEARPNVGYYYVGLSPKDQTAEILRSYSVHDVLSQAVIVSPETNLYDTIVTIFYRGRRYDFGLRRFLFTRCCITQGFIACLHRSNRCTYNAYLNDYDTR